MNSRSKYFIYRKQKWKVVDHGILGGILLYDRLIKIRRAKKKENEDNLFWGKKLENQYKLAANAISIHNIWLPKADTKKEYKKYNLNEIIDFTKIKFKDFPFFYILGIVDTIEPLKTYKDCGFDDNYILKNIGIEFSNKSVFISNKPGSKLDFQKLINQTKYLEGWLDIEVIKEKNSFKLLLK
jgi:hypothetical protein